MHFVCLLLGYALLAVYAPALMPDAPDPWRYLLFPWLIYILLVALEKAIITAISISSTTGTSPKGKTQSMHSAIGRDQDIDIGAQSFWNLEDEH